MPLTTSGSLGEVRRRRRRVGIGEPYLPWGRSLYESGHGGHIIRSHDISRNHSMEVMPALGKISRPCVKGLDSHTGRTIPIKIVEDPES